MSNSRIKNLSTVTPAAATYLALDSVGTGTGKASVGAVVTAGLAEACAASSDTLNWNGRDFVSINDIQAGGGSIGGDFAVNGTVSATTGFDAGSSAITSVADPTDAQDAATKAYVDKGGVVSVSATITTTNATPTVALTITTTSNTAIRVEVVGVFGKSDHTASGSGTVSFGALNNAGTLGLVGSTYNDALEASAALSTAVLEADSSGADLLIKVTGIAATTIKWSVLAKVVTLSLA